MWEEIGLPYIFERMRNFSIPVDDQILIESYEGMHLLELLPVPRITIYDEDHFEPGWKKFEMVSLDEYAEPFLLNARDELLSLDLEQEVLTVRSPDGSVIQEIKFNDLSGDWGVATYSVCGKWLVIGVPYNLYVYRWE